MKGHVGVDVWAQQVNHQFMQQQWLESLIRWTGISREAPPLENFVAAMDDQNIEMALLSAWYGPSGPLITNDEVAEQVAAYPHRFRGLGSIDLSQPARAVREVRRSVEELGFVGIRVVPWLWDLPPNDRRYYPIYATCVEYGVPLCTQVGHTGPLCPSEPGRPIPYVDDVLREFPELVVVGGHVGYPWIHEVLSLAMKYPNFYVDTSAYAVHRLPSELIDFMRGRGRTRVLFGSNWPMLSPARALERVEELALDDEALGLFLGGNARRVFALEPDHVEAVP